MATDPIGTVPHVSDFTQAPQKILYDLIKSDNPSNGFAEGMVTYGIPTSNDTDVSGRNTDITLTSVEGSGIVGSRTVTYRRLRLDGFVKDPDYVVAKRDFTKLSELIPQINADLGINITADDFNEVDLPVFGATPGEEHDVTITFKANSLIWVGTYVLTVRGDDIDINLVIPVDKLSGLNLPE